eukprot:1614291-Rhodomonas_salina.1
MPSKSPPPPPNSRRISSTDFCAHRFSSVSALFRSRWLQQGTTYCNQSEAGGGQRSSTSSDRVCICLAIATVFIAIECGLV